MAVIYAGLGDKEQSFIFLEKALKELTLNMLLLKVDRRFVGLRSDSRFTDVLRRIGVDEDA